MLLTKKIKFLPVRLFYEQTCMFMSSCSEIFVNALSDYYIFCFPFPLPLRSSLSLSCRCRTQTSDSHARCQPPSARAFKAPVQFHLVSARIQEFGCSNLCPAQAWEHKETNVSPQLWHRRPPSPLVHSAPSLLQHEVRVRA